MKRVWNLMTLWRRRLEVGATPAEVAFRENKWRLLRYRPRREGTAFRTPVLLVPSLINRHYVLDLMPGKSFAEYLVQRGHSVYAIDWGSPGDEDRYLSFDDVCDRYLGRAIRVAARESPRQKVHVLGYCMGGTLGAIHASVHPEHFASLTALAAPVRFSEGGLLAAWTRSSTFDLDALLEAFGNVPWPLMQSAFHMLRPTLSLSKAVQLVDRAWNDEFLDSFLAIETWGNDNVSLPGGFYRRYIEDLYRRDAFAGGTFTLSGRPARPQEIRCPLLVVTFEHDNIVPSSSARPLLEWAQSQDKQLLHLPGGHVGAVVSKKAASGLWVRLSDFWAARDGVVRAEQSMPAA